MQTQAGIVKDGRLRIAWGKDEKGIAKNEIGNIQKQIGTGWDITGNNESLFGIAKNQTGIVSLLTGIM